MSDDLRARRGEETCMDTINRALSELGDDADRIVIVAFEKDGDKGNIYSNARSEPEMFGMLHMALHMAKDVDEEE